MSTAVVIVGGGFGGLEAAFTLRSLTGDAVTITLVDLDGFHSFIPSIHEVSSGKITSRSIQIPLATVLAPAGIRFVRDAVTSLSAGDLFAEKTNVGLVPLINFKLERRLGDRASFLLEGDALAAPQGRAEDIFAGVLVHANDNWSVKAGYRILEGGADNDEVYTFALIHYAAVGVVVRF